MTNTATNSHFEKKEFGGVLQFQRGSRMVGEASSRNIKLINHMSTAQRRKGGGERGKAALYIHRNRSVTYFLRQDSTTSSNNAN